ncbi:MAG: iron-sulfur cluster repair di-iron protein [Acidimicrobiales bacterium]|nr:iron-sulfur cluster repair di-iron protein [Acidimicrobiales bacterium]
MSITDSTSPNLDETLGALVAAKPARARVLEQFGLDYCCNGHRTVAEASTAAGLDPAAVVERLATVSDDAGSEIDDLEPVDLVDHILETHHAYLHEELPLLVQLATKVRDVHGERHPELVRVAELVSHVHADLAPHLAKEEQVLFPAIRDWADGERSFPFGTLSRPVQVMMTEHDQAGELLRALRTATRDFEVPDDGCASYRALYERLEALEADTHRHIHLENNVLFPAVTVEP